MDAKSSQEIKDAEICRQGSKGSNDNPKLSLGARLGGGIVWFLKDQWFLFGIAVVVIVASQVQVPAQHQEAKQVIVSYLSGMLCPRMLMLETCLIENSVYHLLHHRLYFRHQDPDCQLLEMEAAHLHSTAKLPHGVSSGICRCHPHRHK